MKYIFKNQLFRFLALQILAAVLVVGIVPRIFYETAEGGEGLIRDSAAACRLNPNGDPTPVKVSLWRHEEKKAVTLDLETYVAGVVAGEMPSSFEPEALKAQAVAARTYAVSKILRAQASGNSADHPSCPLCDDVHCQVYRSQPELKNLKSEEWFRTGWPKIQSAVKETAGQVLYYNGQLVEQPLFHSSSGGKTENSEDVFVSALPYLRSVESEYEQEAPHQSESVSFSLSEFASKMKNAYGAVNINKDNIKILSRSEGGRVDSIQVGSKVVNGRQIRDLFGLRSANFTVSCTDSQISFRTSGYGHGVGMSQWGANGMAQHNYDYIDILTHYYSGTNVGVY